MDPLKMYFLLKMGIFHCYVSLPEGKAFFFFVGSCTGLFRSHGWSGGLGYVHSLELMEPVAPEHRPSQRKSSIPTIHFEVRAVSFREGIYTFISHNRRKVRVQWKTRGLFKKPEVCKNQGFVNLFECFLTQRPFDFFQADVLTIALVGPPNIFSIIFYKKNNNVSTKNSYGNPWKPI